MNSEDAYPLIDKALSGSLTPEESSKLTVLMTSKEFAKEFEYREMVKIAAIREGRKDLKAQFRLADKAQKVRRLYPLKLWASIAAASILLIAAIFIIQLNNSQDNEYYANYYERLENTMVPIQRGDNEMDELKRGFIAYNAKNYDEASSSFSSLINRYPDLKIYQASIAMERNDFEKAVELLEPITLDKSAKYNTEAKWYLALARLKMDQSDKAETIIRDLSAQDGFYAKKARTLAAELQI